jgi:hypothetical protein
VGLGSVVILGLLVYLSRFLFPYFSIDKSITYWKTFGSASFLDRGWFQTFIQFGKSVLYASPLLVVPALFIDKDIWAKTRPLFLFVFIGLTFYLVMFDFSIGALDRYFQYLIVPFCIVSAAVFTKHFGASVQNEEQKKSNIFIPIIASAVIFFLQFVPHYIPPLHPKALWLSKMLSLKWNFLFPFTGGSGPLPFYVSFLFISCVWAICLLIFIYSIRRPNFKKQALVYVFVLGIVYNAVFIEEYLFGLINGSAQKLVNDSVAYIVQNKDIKEVMVYNDNGGFEMHESGKYSRRIYAAPQFVDTYKPIFDKYSGHILFIDIPRLSDDSMYKQYFDSCKIIYNESSKQISSKIYDCAK